VVTVERLGLRDYGVNGSRGYGVKVNGLRLRVKS